MPPCHDSLQGEGRLMLRQLGAEVVSVPGCCSEAGTLALSRPDIAGAMRTRKRDHLLAISGGTNNTTNIVTNCPSCISGLGRNRDLGLVPQHLAVLLAESLGGRTWQQDLAGLLKGGELIRF
jgi:Fe-S oxidoreductase